MYGEMRPFIQKALMIANFSGSKPNLVNSKDKWVEIDDYSADNEDREEE